MCSVPGRFELRFGARKDIIGDCHIDQNEAR
jgi:hypothetical protein